MSRHYRIREVGYLLFAVQSRRGWWPFWKERSVHANRLSAKEAMTEALIEDLRS